MDTSYLKSFLKIAETGSISRASESLGIAQPSLSQQLQRLEEEVGVPLFQRTARGVTLTEAGRIFQEHAARLLRSSDLAIQEVRQLSAEPRGAVVLAVPYSISKLAGFTLIETFLRRAPQVRLRLVEAMTGQIRGWLEAGKIDLGIMNELGPMRNLLSRRLATEELYLVGPPGRFGSLDAPSRVGPADLSALPMILPGPQHGLRQLIEQEAGRLGATISVRIDIDAMMHVPLLIATGEGYSILPLPAIRDELKGGRISIARIGDGLIRRTLCLVHNGAQVMTQASARCDDLTTKVLMSLIDRGAWEAEPAKGTAGA